MLIWIAAGRRGWQLPKPAERDTLLGVFTRQFGTILQDQHVGTAVEWSPVQRFAKFRRPVEQN